MVSAVPGWACRSPPMIATGCVGPRGRRGHGPPKAGPVPHAEVMRAAMDTAATALHSLLAEQPSPLADTPDRMSIGLVLAYGGFESPAGSSGAGWRIHHSANSAQRPSASRRMTHRLL
jgi:hypothetical protein